MNPEEQKINTPIQDLINETKKDGTVGPVAGSIIIVILILVGGLYFFSSIVSNKKIEIETKQAFQEQEESASVENITKQSDSDETSSIEADLKATNIESLDSQINEIDQEF